MPDRINTKIKQLWERFKGKAFRDAFVSAELSANIAAQITTMREDRGWTQATLAEKSGMAQSRVSLLESPDYDRASLTTLKRLASAFDVGLAVRFVPYSDNVAWSVPIRENHLSVPSFSADSMPLPHGTVQSRVVRLVVYANDEKSNVVDMPTISTAGTTVSEFVVNPEERRYVN